MEIYRNPTPENKKPSITQAVLERHTSVFENIKCDIQEVSDSIRRRIEETAFLEDVTQEYKDTMIKELETILKHLNGAYKKIKNLHEVCYNEWNRLYKLNQYWQKRRNEK